MKYKNIFIDNNLVIVDNFFNFMQNEFEYGWIDINGNKHYGVNDAQSYCLQSPTELLNSRVGICSDTTELYRCFFENMASFKYETYYLFYDGDEGCPSYSILIFYNNDKVYWLEPMFNDKKCFYSGIHEYNNITKLLEDFKTIFIKYSIINKLIPIDYNSSNIQIYKYDNPSEHIIGYQMREHINSSQIIINF